MNKIGTALCDLGNALDNGDTTISVLVDTAKELGMAIQFRLVPFNETLYLLTGSDKEDADTTGVS